MYKINILLLIISLFFLNRCSDKSIESKPDVTLSELEGPTIVYSLIGDDFIQNRVNYSNNDRKLFKDNNLRLNVKISPDKKHIAYVKNSMLHPWVGYFTDGIPIVTVSDNMGKTENELLWSDSLSLYFIDWISEDKIAVSSLEGSSNYIFIIDLEGRILFRKEAGALYQLYMTPDGRHLAAYNYKKFGVMDVLNYSFQEFEPDVELAAFWPPFYTDSSFIIITYSNEYLEFNLNNNSYKKVSMQDAGGYLIYADAAQHIYYNYKLDKPLRLYEHGSLVDSVAIDGYSCSRGLFFSEGRELYFIGEARNVDDEYVIVKVDFNSGQISRLTNHGEDKIINDLAFYEF